MRRDDERQRHRAAYRRERDVLANADTARLVALLGDENEIKRTAAQDELLRRERSEHAEQR